MEANPIVIALDYDETYTAAPKLWDAFILLAAYNKDIKVLLCTYRHPVHDYHKDFDHLKKLGIECYFSDGLAKKPFMEKQGINVNIWIDDRPTAILQDSAWGQGSPELHAWREENKAKLEDQTLKVSA
jgi:hypothetical protein